MQKIKDNIVGVVITIALVTAGGWTFYDYNKGEEAKEEAKEVAQRQEELQQAFRLGQLQGEVGMYNQLYAIINEKGELEMAEIIDVNIEENKLNRAETKIKVIKQ